MVRLRQAIVVEGRYDKNTLSQIVDAPILETHGFGIPNAHPLYKHRENLDGFADSKPQTNPALGIRAFSLCGGLYYSDREALVEGVPHQPLGEPTWHTA